MGTSSQVNPIKIQYFHSFGKEDDNFQNKGMTRKSNQTYGKESRSQIKKYAAGKTKIEIGH